MKFSSFHVYWYCHCSGLVCSAMYRRHSLTADFLLFWLFPPPLPRCFLNHGNRRCCRYIHGTYGFHDVLISILCPLVVFCDVSICSKEKLLWWWIVAMLICGIRIRFRIQLGIMLASKGAVVDFLVRSRTSLTMHSWLGFQYQHNVSLVEWATELLVTTIRCHSLHLYRCFAMLVIVVVHRRHNWVGLWLLPSICSSHKPAQD